MGFSRSAPARWRRSSWYDLRLPLWLRVPLLVAVGWLAVLWIGAVASHYQDVMAYRHASVCPAGPVGAAHCVAPDTGDVQDKRTGESCSTDANNNTSCTPYYDVRLHRASGTIWISIGSHTYDDVRKGDHADLLTWHGAVVRMVVHGHTETYPPPAESSMFWPLAGLWLLLGLATWLAFSGRPNFLFAFGNFGVFWLAMPVAWFVQGLLLGMGWVLRIFSIAFIAFGVYWTLGAWEMHVPRCGRGFGRWWWRRGPRRSRGYR